MKIIRTKVKKADEKGFSMTVLRKVKKSDAVVEGGKHHSINMRTGEADAKKGDVTNATAKESLEELKEAYRGLVAAVGVTGDMKYKSAAQHVKEAMTILESIK